MDMVALAARIRQKREVTGFNVRFINWEGNPHEASFPTQEAANIFRANVQRHGRKLLP